MSTVRNLLVVDDDPGILDWLEEDLTRTGHLVHKASSGAEALRLIEDLAFDVVVSDIEMPKMRGVDLVKAIHARRPAQLVILMTAFGSIELAMQCVRAGASDFLAKPFSLDALVQSIERTVAERRLRREVVRLTSPLAESDEAAPLVARSAAMVRALDLARRAASSDSTVLLTGESGVGKSAIARFIHERSGRSRRRFVQLNCAALPAGLVEAELFGVRRGAYTDAREDRTGLFAHADGGTLLLDEIGDMAVDVQPKLLLALESGSYRPVGARDEVKADVRLVAATNQRLEDAVRERRLRADLYHRINVIRIEVPPLRERTEEIPELVDAWLKRLAPRAGRQLVGVTDEAMRWLCGQSWPGNVRELANVLERAVMLSDHDVLLAEDFVEGRGEAEAEASLLERAAMEGLALEEVERRYIQLVLDRVDGNKAKAARILGVDRTTLYRRGVRRGDSNDR
jgi:DNA-binding NtrC family response regulator